jgi:hypothetical protein
VHYLEESLLPFVEALRSVAYGDQSYSSALTGCENLRTGDVWVHPTTLALTVYGDAQVVLEEAFGPHGPEVLPAYSEVRRGDHELGCVAEFLIAVGDREHFNGNAARVFRFQIPYARYGLDSGWVSGLTQGVVGQVLLAYYLKSGDAKYLVAARETGRFLAVDLDQGGVRVSMNGGGAWYEEYAQKGVSPPLVLNGHLLALDFLYWLSLADSDPVWDAMFDAGIKAAVAEIDRYLSFAWSFYDQNSNLATRKYQSFHVRQLDRYSMHDPTGKLKRAGEKMRWQLMVPLGIFERLVTQPSRLLLLLVGLFFIILFPVTWLFSKKQTKLEKLAMNQSSAQWKE